MAEATPVRSSERAQEEGARRGAPSSENERDFNR
jgi:hypothetical protein